jgi:hypothetical protein
MTEGIGNTETVRIIADQLFDVWQERQAREARENRKWWQSNLGGWLAAGITVVGVIVAGANIHNIATDANARSLNNEAAIIELRATNGDRLARIETKIDLMMEERKR